MQIFYIKQHLRDIQNAIDNETLNIKQDAHTLYVALRKIRDTLVERMQFDNAFYNNLGFAVMEIRPMIEKIQGRL
jgi:F420-dependent methylenetetrahydromethanopterin dehydrogenase